VEKQTDVVIIGGGITGCATAYNLAKRGTHVILVEKGEISGEASGTNAGAVRQQGKEAPELILMVESMKMWQGLDRELKCDIGYVQGGNLLLAETQADAEMLETAVKECRASSLDVKMITIDAARKIVPGLEGAFNAASFCPGDSHADPVKTTLGFANAAQRFGAKLYTRCTALAVEVSGGKVTSVVTAMGEIKTPVVVNAAGMWAQRVSEMVGFHLPTKLLRMTQVETAAQPIRFKAFVRCASTSCKQYADGRFRFVGGYRIPLNYDIGFDLFEDISIWLPRLRRLRSRIKFSLNEKVMKREVKRVLLRKVEFPPQEDPKIDRAIIKKGTQTAYKFMPFLRKIPVMKEVAGYLVLSPDLRPTIGELERPKGFIIAAGFSGHGFGLGPVTGRLISEIILDGRSSLPLEAFRPSRFEEGKIPIPKAFI
jgi:glycine/D-amino acid oxidase-like deaminating enzyme